MICLHKRMAFVTLVFCFTIGAAAFAMATANSGKADPASTAKTDGRAKADAESAEAYVLKQVADGNPAMFSARQSRTLSGSFIADLLTNSHIRMHHHGIMIDGAVIPDGIDLTYQEVSHNVTFSNCRFEGDLDLSGCHFEKGLSFEGSTFNGTMDLSSATIDLIFTLSGSSHNDCQCNSYVTFKYLKAAGDFYLERRTFLDEADFSQLEVGGNLLMDESEFREKADFDTVRVRGNGYFRRTKFFGDVDFSDASFVNLLFTGAQFNNKSQLDIEEVRTKLAGLRMDTGVLDSANFEGKVNIEGMTFQNLTPTSWEKLQGLAASFAYDAEFYSSLESLFRKHGYFDQADAVFIAKRRREREQSSEKWLAWSGNLFQDWFIGYGRHLERLLLWSAVFVLIGILVFRREDDMRTKKPEDADRYEGKYSAFWYSLDLFLPVMHLGDADIWTPKDERRKALLYKRFHVIVGGLFIPIGLAAWTGIIK